MKQTVLRAAAFLSVGCAAGISVATPFLPADVVDHAQSLCISLLAVAVVAGLILGERDDG